MAQGPPPRRSARQPSAGRHGYQDGGYADGAYNDDGYQGGAPNGFYEDQYQEDQYQDAGYEEGPVTGQYDVPRQQYADERDGDSDLDESPDE